MSRQRRIPTPTWHSGDVGGSRFQLYAMLAVGALALAAVIVVGVAFLADYLEDRGRPGSLAMQVGDMEYSVSDYTERARIYTQTGGNTNYQVVLSTVSQQVTRDFILLQFQDELGISASEDEVKEQIATLLGITAEDANFDQRLQEQLASIDLTEEQYRDIARAAVLNDKAIEHFESELPETVESVHYRQIRVDDQTTADELKQEIEAGADFATVAAENSTDTATAGEGGDAGWAPRGYLQEALENVLFSLEIDDLITYPTGSGVVIYQLTEKDEARAIDDDKKGSLAAGDYNEWLEEKQDEVEFKNEMDLVDGNVDKIRYVIDHAELTVQ